MPPRESGRGDFPDEGGYPPRGDGADAATQEIPLERLDEDEVAGLYYDSPGLRIGPHQPLAIEEEPSALVSRYLFPTEKFRGEWRKHWIHLVKEFLIGAIATFVIGWATGFTAKHDQKVIVSFLLIIWVLVMIYVAWRISDWYF